MIDTTFGNVQANLSYKKMIELVGQLKVGDTVKLRDDLVEGTMYTLEDAIAYFARHFSERPLKSGEIYKILEIDTFDKSICLRVESGRGLLWIPYNMIDIDWLFLKQVITQNKLEKEKQFQHKTEEKDFYQQAQELNEIAHKELQEAVDKLNEAISKVNTINKVVGAVSVKDYLMHSIASIELEEDSRNFNLKLLKQ